MTWTVERRDEVPAYVAFTLSGVLEKDELSNAFFEVLTQCRDHDIWLVLTDCSSLLGGHTVFDLFGLMQVINQVGGADRFREALIAPTDPEAAKLVEYWVEAGTKLGVAMRVFADGADALAWLRS
jgi:hypothetical protein